MSSLKCGQCGGGMMISDDMWKCPKCFCEPLTVERAEERIAALDAELAGLTQKLHVSSELSLARGALLAAKDAEIKRLTEENKRLSLDLALIAAGQTHEERATATSQAIARQSDRIRDDVQRALKGEVKKLREELRQAEAEAEQLQAALEWATKQLGRAPERSALEWSEKHMNAWRAGGFPTQPEP